MNFSTRAAQDILEKIQHDPAEVRHWRQLLILCFDQKDVDSLQSYQSILNGLEQVWNRRKQKAKEAHDIAKQRQRATGSREPLPSMHVFSISLSSRQKESLIKLAQDPRSPTLLYRFGLQLEEEFDLPDSAHALYDRALALTTGDEAIEQKLVEALTRLHARLRESTQIKEVSHTGGVLSAEPMGVRSPSHHRPNTASLFKRTGRLTPDRGKIQTSSGRLSEGEWSETQKRLEDAMNRVQTHAAAVCETAPRPMRLPRSIAPVQWLDFLEDHVTLLLATLEAQGVDLRTAVRLDQAPPREIEDHVVVLLKLLDEIDQALLDFRPASEGESEEESEPKETPTTRSLGLNPVDAAFTKIETGAWAEAEQLLRQMESGGEVASEQLSEIWFHLGLAYQGEQQRKQAITAYQRACQLNDQNLQAWFNSGMIMHEEGMLRPAHDCYIHAADIDPAEPKIWCNLGVLQFQLGEFEASVNSLNKAVSLKPDYARAWDNLAGSLCAVDQLTEAERCCHRAINYKSDYPDPHFKLGSIYFQQGRYEEAEKAFDRVLEWQPGYPLAGHYLAMVLARSGRLDEALAICEIAAVPPAETELPSLAWNELGFQLYEKGEYEKALACYERALAFTPEKAVIWLDAGATLHQLGRIEEARVRYEQALNLDSDLARAWHNLGAVRQQLGDRAGAKGAFSQAQKLMAGNIQG